MLRKSLKQLANTRDISLDTWLEKAEINPTDRPETVDIAGFHRLTEILLTLG